MNRPPRGGGIGLHEDMTGHFRTDTANGSEGSTSDAIPAWGADYGAPASNAGYGAPASNAGYGAPPQSNVGYGAPTSSYGAPPTSYAPASGGFAAPPLSGPKKTQPLSNKGGSSAEGRLNSVLNWLEGSQEADTRELNMVERELQGGASSTMLSETSSTNVSDNSRPVHRDDTVAAIMGDGMDYQADPKSSTGKTFRKASSRGGKCGIGITFRNPDGRKGRVIKRIKETGPAAQSGRIKVGDRVLAVDEVLVSDDMRWDTCRCTHPKLSDDMPVYPKP
jgi:hypothetical protein